MARCLSLGVAAIVVLLGGGPASADMSAQDAWNGLRADLESIGYTVSIGGLNTSGDSLTVSDLVVGPGIFFDPGGEGEVYAELDELTFRELGNGSVEISLSDDYTVSASLGDGDEHLNLVLTASRSDLSIVASGDENETTYVIAAAGITVEATTFEFGGRPMNGDMRMDLSDYAGSYAVTRGESAIFRTSDRIALITIAANFDNPEDDSVFDLAARVEDPSLDAHMTLPEAFDPENMALSVANGFAVSTEYATGALNLSLSSVEAGENLDIEINTGNAEGSFGMSADGLGVSERVQDLSVILSGSDIPFPQIAVSAAEAGANILMPVSGSKQPQDLALGLRLVDLDVQDEIWGIFDPAGMLPHDPLTLIVETEGKGNWFFDVMDPAEQQSIALGGEVPGALHALTLGELRLSVAGAELTGNGGFTFDNSDLATFGGLPRPAGALDLKLIGGNALLDALVAMDLLPENQAMAARMIMGLFAIAGPQEDELTSKIEVNAEGQVLANGQRLR